MALALLLARLALTGVFLVSGIAKLADRPGSRQAMQDFGVPAILTGPAAIVLPVVELAVALALLVRGTAWYGALGAFLLLLFFIVGISVNMVHGRAPDCHCFGQLHAEPIGWRTLARNGALLIVAGFVVWQGQTDAGLSTTGWLHDHTGFERTVLIAAVVGLALLVAQGWLLLYLLEQHGRLLIRLDEMETRGNLPANAPATPAMPTAGLPVGTRAPAFALGSLDGEIVTLDALRAGGMPLLLLFTDPNCGLCNALLPMIGRWEREVPATIALISRGTPEANRAKSAEHGLGRVLLQQDREVAASYQATVTPSAVLVRPDGTIGSPVALGGDAIVQLVASIGGAPALAAAPTAWPVVAAQQAAPPAPASQPSQGAPVTLGIGLPAPAIRLPNLAGDTVTLDAFRGSSTLILFWDPGHAACMTLLPSLQVWEAGLPDDGAQLLVISTGTPEANQAMGLRATILLDHTFSIAPTYGVSGVPAAILIDANGRIASGIAVGDAAILALADANQGQMQTISF